jgi:hypothetical protein
MLASLSLEQTALLAEAARRNQGRSRSSKDLTFWRMVPFGNGVVILAEKMLTAELHEVRCV